MLNYDVYIIMKLRILNLGRGYRTDRRSVWTHWWEQWRHQAPGYGGSCGGVKAAEAGYVEYINAHQRENIRRKCGEVLAPARVWRERVDPQNRPIRGHTKQYMCVLLLLPLAMTFFSLSSKIQVWINDWIIKFKREFKNEGNESDKWNCLSVCVWLYDTPQIAAVCIRVPIVWCTMVLSNEKMNSIA